MSEPEPEPEIMDSQPLSLTGALIVLGLFVLGIVAAVIWA